MNNKYSNRIIIFLIVISCVAFGRIANNDFINFDDTVFIANNHYIQHGFNREIIKWAFSTIYHSYWHPLTWLSITLDWSLFGANAGGHHLVSLLLHIGASIFLFLFLYKTTINIWPSAFAAAFFALHPLRVESVAWAAERKDVLSMFFGMATLYAYSFYTEKFSLPRYFICLVLFVFSLMSKPMMVTIPFVLLLLDYWPLGRWQVLSSSSGNALKTADVLIREKIPFFILTIVASIFAVWAQNKVGTVVSMEGLPFLTRATNAVFSYMAYLGKIFWPVNLAVFYPYEYSLPLWKVLISGIILIAITLAVLYFIRKLPFLFVGWFWYLGTLIPVIGLVQVGSQAMADRYTYLPSIGIAIILAWGIPLLFQRAEIRKKILFSLAIVVLCVLAFLTWMQCGYWKNSITLFSQTLRVTKDNYLAHNNLGVALSTEGIIKEAIDNYNEALSIKPNYAEAYNNRGNAYTKLGQYQLATEDLNRAIRIKPNYAEAYNNQGGVYLLQGNNNLGCRYAQKACKMGVCKALEKAKSNGYCR